MIQYPHGGFLFSWEICCETHFKNFLTDRNTSFVSQRPAVSRYTIERANRNPNITNAVQQPCFVA
jgi:hypothetical protein